MGTFSVWHWLVVLIILAPLGFWIISRSRRPSQPSFNVSSSTPSRWTYISAWILMSMINVGIGKMIEVIFQTQSQSASIFVAKWSVLIDPLTTLVTTVTVFYLVYVRLFRSLDTAKVLPWLYGLGSLGVLGGLGKTLPIFDQPGVEELISKNLYISSTIIFWVLTCAAVTHISKRFSN